MHLYRKCPLCSKVCLKTMLDEHLIDVHKMNRGVQKKNHLKKQRGFNFEVQRLAKSWF
jgi:phage FluMu protein Com